MAHLVLEMLVQFRRNKRCVCNPVASSTFMCEDFIGRVARISRRVSPRVQGQKVINRYLTALKAALHQEAWSEQDREKRGYAVVSRNDCFWLAVSLRPFIDRCSRPQVRVFSFSLRLLQYTYAICFLLLSSPFTHRNVFFSGSVRVQLWCQQSRSVAMVRSDGWPETKASQMTSDSFHFTKLSFRVSQCLPNILSQIQKGNVSTLACIWALDCSAAAWGGTLRAMAKKNERNRRWLQNCAKPMRLSQKQQKYANQHGKNNAS